MTAAGTTKTDLYAELAEIERDLREAVLRAPQEPEIRRWLDEIDKYAPVAQEPRVITTSSGTSDVR